MMNRSFHRIFLLFALICAGLMQRAQAQEVVFSGSFETRFDNREYSACDYGEAFTLFGMGFSPEVGIQWQERNRLMVGANLTHEFGDEKGLSESAFMAYYQYQDEQFRVNAGIFPRGKMIGNYSEAFFDDKTTFYHDPLQGILFNFQSKRNSSYAELLIDWEGLRTETQREQFALVMEGRWDNDCLYAGGTLLMRHYAKSYNPAANEGVVDNLLVNPHVGLRVGQKWQFEARLGYLQALQRDRLNVGEWESPKGGELWLRLGFKGFEVENRLYVGENLLPLYPAYGEELFESSTFYGVEGNLYNRTAVSYARSLFGDTLEVGAALVFHYDGVGLGFQQVLKVGVNLEKALSLKKK